MKRECSILDIYKNDIQRILKNIFGISSNLFIHQHSTNIKPYRILEIRNLLLYFYAL